MKKTVWKKHISMILVACTLLSLASCAASFDNIEGNFSGGAYPDAAENWPGESYLDITCSNMTIHEPGSEDPDYNKLIENAWVKTADEATSTFSSDVDTASYSRFRAFVNSGVSYNIFTNVYSSMIRTEEMLNYFKYETNSPENGDLFGIRSEIAPCPWNPASALLMMNFKAKEASVENKGNNLVFLIDVSGSMYDEDKLPLLKTAFKTLVNALTDRDTVSIVTYSGVEKVVLTGCSGADKNTILKAVNSLEASGSTNGSAGMERAYSIAADYFIEGGNNRIIMATDGDLNVGITTTDGILEYVEKKRDSGIYITTLGFGTNGYSDAILETIADNGNGAYYFIDGEAEAEKVFGTDLLSTLYTVAEDVKFQISFSPDAVSEYRLVGYENRVMSNEDFENDAKDAGEVGSGQQLVVFYELKLTGAGGDDDDWMKLSVRYKDPGEKESKLNEYGIGSKVYTDSASKDFTFATAVIMASMLLHESKYIAREDVDLAFVKALLADTDTSDYYRSEFAGLIEKLIKNDGKI